MYRPGMGAGEEVKGMSITIESLPEIVEIVASALKEAGYEATGGQAYSTTAKNKKTGETRPALEVTFAIMETPEDRER